MAEEAKKTNKPKNTETNKKVTIAFFVILIIGLIILTVILLTRTSSKIYTRNYGDVYRVSLEVFTDGKVDLAIDIGNNRVIQSGTYESISENEYVLKLEDKSDPTNVVETTLNMTIEDKTLTLIYPDGATVSLIEYEPVEKESDSTNTEFTDFNKETK